ncbi:hypothetical protein [Poriferisphaera sp. WC338]|uniref:hypothetical protein n=1 Tax=Poriferisphaera sp. WC338 TaxID=3425129 RepID=UPI003D8155EA
MSNEPWNENDPNAQPPLSPQVPPTQPGAIAVQKQPIWPTVIGVIGIILSAFGFLGVFGIALLWFVYLLPDNPFSQSQPQQELWAVLTQTIFQLIFLALCVYLLIGCIKLLKRDAAAGSIMPQWASMYIFIAVLSVVFNIVFTYLNFQQQFQSSGAGGANEEFVQTAAIIGAVVGGIIGLLFALAYPLFVLIWFKRKAIKNQIETWPKKDRYTK